MSKRRDVKRFLEELEAAAPDSSCHSCRWLLVYECHYRKPPTKCRKDLSGYHASGGIDCPSYRYKAKEELA
jgi:hypothetical protein